MPSQPEDPSSHLKYRPDIDGLRALAVLSVVGFHAFPAWMRGGFIGVDIFFVISGYLISTIILGRLAGAGFSYGEFYSRRIRRIFPALLPVLAATLGFGWYVLLSDEFRQLGKHILAGAGFVSNLVLWNESGYFDTAAEAKPLLHLWSLAVEEQFYIVWPLILGLVWRLKGSRRPTLWLAGIWALSFLLNVAALHRHPEATFYSPLSRVWELVTGALLAHADLRRRRPLSSTSSQWRGMAGLVLIVLGLVFIQKEKAFPGWWALLPTVGACLCISAGAGSWINRRLLGSRPLVWIGLISYPLYLWHWPLLAFARVVENGTPDRTTRIGAVVAAVVLAWATYVFVETPVRKSGRRPVVLWLVTGMTVLALLGAAAFARVLLPRNSDPAVQALVSAGSDWGFPDGLDKTTLDKQVVYRLGQGKERVLLLGDSHVEQYAPRAVELYRQQPQQMKTLFFATRGACPPIPELFEDRDPVCGERLASLLRTASSAAVDTVVLGGCWACYFDVGEGKTGASPVPAPDHYYLRESGVRHFLRGGDGVEKSLASLATMIKSLRAAGKRVYLILNIPVGENFEPKSLIAGSRLTTMRAAAADPAAALTPSQKRLHERLARVAREAGADVIDPLPSLCDAADRCLRSDTGGVPVYKDATHLRATHVKRFATFLDRAIVEAR